MSITNETRRGAYDEILETLGKRQSDVYYELLKEGSEGCTANELAYKMYQRGYFITPERNRVHPRLHELVKDDYVKTIAKKKCSISGKLCAVYVANKEKKF